MSPSATSRARNWSRDSLSLGVGIRTTRSVEIAKMMATAGFDWLFLDMEHGTMSLDACAQIAAAALDAGIAPIARVPNGAVLDRHAGAGQRRARHRHAACRYRRRGARGGGEAEISAGRASFGGRLGTALPVCEAVSTGEAVKALNAANLTVVMLETPTAIANADEIAAVPGVDVLLIGIQRSVRGDGHPRRFRQRSRWPRHIAKMIAACAQAWKIPRHGGHLQRGDHAALHRDGRALHPVGRRCGVHDGRRQSRTGFLRKTLQRT